MDLKLVHMLKLEQVGLTGKKSIKGQISKEHDTYVYIPLGRVGSSYSLLVYMYHIIFIYNYYNQ